ncbi:MAG: hypothetical protein DRJ03_00860 [Chloroflexi bacterium]|nr:MAG: hypothetical protein DRJ03_00860 [Chloroflexota bacterium]
MAAAKAPIFKEEGVIGNPELLDQLEAAVEQLTIQMKATIPITKGQAKVGFGVSKLQRGIEADRVIAIARAIKSLKGW